jgi:Predicted pyridoxal phosphate-dependent enzyme apparently involved in regulation of cell wall biogenesis
LEDIILFIKKLFPGEEIVPLHAPVFIGNEKKYVLEAIDSTFVSSVGKFVNIIEERIAQIAGSKYAVATVNGTSALHIALKIAGVQENDEVLTQPLTFIATANAISYLNAAPVFLDIDEETLGLSPRSLKNFLERNAIVKDNRCVNKLTGRTIAACVPMHTFGFSCKIDEIVDLCDAYCIPVIEDAAEALGTTFKNKHVGTFGKAGIFSFNGNKIVTSGGGGIIITNDQTFAQKAKHLTTTAKKPHPWEFFHDEIGYNYRMPNLNAALLLGQLEKLDDYVLLKRKLAGIYDNYFKNSKNITFLTEPIYCKSNYWLNTLRFDDESNQLKFLEVTNSQGINTRPFWTSLNKLPMYHNCLTDDLSNCVRLEKLIVNLPSSINYHEL